MVYVKRPKGKIKNNNRIGLTIRVLSGFYNIEALMFRIGFLLKGYIGCASIHSGLGSASLKSLGWGADKGQCKGFRV